MATIDISVKRGKDNNIISATFTVTSGGKLDIPPPIPTLSGEKYRLSATVEYQDFISELPLIPKAQYDKYKGKGLGWPYVALFDKKISDNVLGTTVTNDEKQKILGLLEQLLAGKSSTSISFSDDKLYAIKRATLKTNFTDFFINRINDALILRKSPTLK